MKTKLRLLSMLLVLVFALTGFTACYLFEPKDESSTDENYAETLYNNAVEKLLDQKNFRLETEYHLNRTVGVETLKEWRETEGEYISYGEEDMRVYSISDVSYANQYRSKFYETYVGGNVFVTYNVGRFMSEMSADEYLERVIPPNLFDTELYSQIILSEENSETGEINIVFSSADKVEKWAAPEYSEIISVFGKAVIDADGNLISSSCELVFEQGSVEVELSVTVNITVLDESRLPEIDEPENKSYFKEIDYLEAPELARKTECLVSTVDVFEYNTEITIYSDMTDFFERSLLSVLYYSHGEKTAGYISTAFKYDSPNADYGPENRFKFIGDRFEFSYGDGYSYDIPQEEADMLIDMAFSYLSYTFVEETCIANVCGEVDDGYIYLTLSCDEDYAAMLNESLSEVCFTDDLAYKDACKIKKAEVNLKIDPDTLLPVERSLDYQGICIVDGEEYEFGYQISGDMVVGSNTLYDRIKGKNMQEY